MYPRLIYISIVGLLLGACAQVGSISGGPKDEIAPQIKTMSPENKALNFHGNGFEIEFEDFIKLNNPAQTISVIPPDFKVKTAVKGKTLFLNWDEPLKENTTYSIFLNETVQDITENNDSIIQIVFSTGNVLDSLSYSAFLQDALTLEASNKITVGLFEAEDSLKPMYFAQTDATGKASFNYVKQGNYFIRAFDDVNKDLQISKTEKVGFKIEPVQIDSAIIDSIPFKLFTPLLPPKISSPTFQSPGAFIIAANRSLENAQFHVNGKLIDSTQLEYITKDSLKLYAAPTEQNPTEIIVQSEDFNDTLKVRILESAKKKALSIVGPNGNTIVPSSSIVYTVFDEISQIDTAKMNILLLPDSILLKNYSYSIDRNKLTLDLQRKGVEKYKIDFGTGAVIGVSSSQSNPLISSIRLMQENEIGVLNIDVSNYTEPIILQVYLAGKKVNEFPIAQPSLYRLTDLIPGDYSFRVVVDENGNGKWDTGNFSLKTLPEEIQLFSEITKVRANWEIELKLVPKN